MPPPSVRVIRFSQEAALPERAAAGYELRALRAVTLESGERAVLPTGIGLELPEGMLARVEAHDGLAAQHGVVVLNGVVEPGFLGEINVILLNAGSEPVDIRAGDCIAQAVFLKHETLELFFGLQ